MAKKYIDIEELHDDHFVGEQSGRSITVKAKISPTTGNLLTSDSTGLKVIPANITIPEYLCNATDRVRQNNGNKGRKMLVSPVNAWGQIHLDFVYTHTNTRDSQWGEVIYNLPPNAPVPRGLIEVQVDVNAGTTCWLDGGSRAIKVIGCVKGKRYILDLQGFFRL